MGRGSASRGLLAPIESGWTKRDRERGRSLIPVDTQLYQDREILNGHELEITSNA